MNDEEALDRAVEEHRNHLAVYSTRYDSKGRVRFKDEGALSCSCNRWAETRTDENLRPWPAWHRHVVEAVLAAFESAPVTGRHVEQEPDPTESSFAAMARLSTGVSASGPVCTDKDCPVYARHRAKGQVFPPHGPHDFRAGGQPS